MKQQRMGKQKKMALETVLYTLPALFLVALVIYIPFVLSGFYSLTKWNGIAKEPEFIGLENFINLFSGDKGFLQSLLFTGKYTLLFMIFANVLALALAVLLTKKIRSANMLRGFFFIPYIMSMTIVGFIWKFIFSQGFAKLYEMTQMEFLNLSWLGNPDLAFYSIVFVGIWQSVGFYIVLYIAGLQAVPQDVQEAAIVDGANGVQKFFRVILPLLAPSITTCIFMSLTNSLKVFDIILALTKGGPGSSTYSVTLDIYREAFQNNNYGYGAAKSLVFFVVILVLTQLVLKGFKSREVEL
ncbi:MAG: sugar ABC transporter permease [Lachnospiraceae bacterium]|nr:sugar ABC transporter permease [Lachnospiraceae bacterium]MDD3661231.1 sugar ABC transporter permease [Lachnospiraceae bacterium]